jgi:triosephosphate isomerase
MKTILVCNWKMNPPNWKSAKKLFEETKKTAAKAKNVSVIVAPPSLYLREIAALNVRGGVPLAIQAGHHEEGGAHTGEISLAQAADSRATYAIVGHAERRARGESDLEINKQILAALAHKMTPILCVGEKVRSMQGEYFEVVRAQVKGALAAVPQNRIAHVIVAYEPVWAIGAPAPMQPRDMHEMGIFIRKVIVEGWGDVGHAVTILYGGAVDSTNAATMRDEGDVRGFLVGRASAEADKVKSLIQSLA